MATTLHSFCLELENQDIEIIKHECTCASSQDEPIFCVLGVLATENGRQIERYMLSWLQKKYTVYAIRQQPPGSLYEYPALRFAQLLSMEKKQPVLYLHTKGAANKRKLQCKTVNMWRYEFVEHKSDYRKNLGDYDLLCPYSGPQNITWLNGFIASDKAFSAIPPIEIFENRYYYETLFKGTQLKCFGRRLNNIAITEEIDNTNSMYRDLRRFSSLFSFSFSPDRLNLLVKKRSPKK